MSNYEIIEKLTEYHLTLEPSTVARCFSTLILYVHLMSELDKVEKDEGLEIISRMDLLLQSFGETIEKIKRGEEICH